MNMNEKVDVVEELTRMWRAAEYNHDTVGLAIDRIEYLERKLEEKHNNILKHYSTEWDHEINEGAVMVHHNMVEGVLCRWWGDDGEPDGVALIDKIMESNSE